ncbi:hypothetical protein [Mesoflavibacter zeaxanthinifaciens]|uniref:hypothetical protein n=1 Tax=Mesoflavibacter zeaxanthinifaciens TaxID=393060 RepID=UPI003A93F8EE
MAHWWIKYFHWIPLRNYFRAKPINISGKWEEQWYLLETKSFIDPMKRHSHPIIKQMGHGFEFVLYLRFYKENFNNLCLAIVIGDNPIKRRLKINYGKLYGTEI